MEAQVQFHKLKNGLLLMGERVPHRKSAAIGFFVRTGSRDEREKESGVSHFLEHMLFKGTARRSSLDITYGLGNIGAQANAFTSEEHTVYYAGILPEYFVAMQELLSDMMRPCLDVHEYETEKKVILEEIALYQDRPQFYLFEHVMRDYFGTHPAGNSVLGSTQSIAALQRDEMKHYFDRRYAPSNMILVATGDFSWDGFVRDAEEYCGGWQTYAAERQVQPYSGSVLSKEYRKKNLTQAHVAFVAPGSSAQEDERYPMSVLSTILGDSNGSKLYWELIDSGLADSAGADNDERDGTGLFMVYASTEPSRIDEVERIIERILRGAADFSDDELERAKTKLATRIVLNGELPMGRLMAIGLEWHYRHSIEPLRTVIERVQAVSRGDIERAVGTYLSRGWSQFRLLAE